MFIYMSKKIAIPKQSNVTCLAWNHSSGYIAVGGEEGMLKVLKLESGGSGNLSMNLSLEGHTGRICVAIWNEVFQKLTTSDEHGVIIVWMLYKGSWYEEMINNRNKSTVAGMAWGSDGQKICIAYEDGAVIVGSVDGSRVWGKDIKGPGLKAVQWSPDNSLLLFALTNGELHLYDDQGNFMMPVASNGVPGSSEVVCMDWFSGRSPANRPVLVICYKNGLMLLMKTCTEEESVIVDTNMTIIDGHWNHNGTVLAVAGQTQEQANVVQFFGAYGEALRSLRAAGGALRALRWEARSLRLALAVDSFIYFANVKPDHKYAFYGDTLAFVSGADTVTFRDTLAHQSWINHIPDVVDMCGVDEYCIIATMGTLIISNRQGIQCDAKAITMPVAFVAINSKSIAVAASKESFMIWKFSIPSRPRITEQFYHADGSPVTKSEGGFQDDTICCISCSDTHLLIGRDSGTILLFSMLNFKKITSINMNTKPYKMGLNSNSSKFFVIDHSGSLYILETEMAHNVSVGQALRREAWGARWAADDPSLLALAEKARVYVLRDERPEEPLAAHGYLCAFKDLEITMALLDDMTEECSPQHIVRMEVKSSRDTRQLIEKVGLKEAEDFIKDNPHPKLWLLLAEAASRRPEPAALETAAAAYVRRGDYAGVRRVARLAALRAPALRRADRAAHDGRTDDAERIYVDEDRRDLAIALRERLGHWFRAVELLKASVTTADARIERAYANIGDYYIDRQNWPNHQKGFLPGISGCLEHNTLISESLKDARTSERQVTVCWIDLENAFGSVRHELMMFALGWTAALEYYTKSNNTNGLKKCYMALEDNESLSKLISESPRQSKESKQNMDKRNDSIQVPSIQTIMQLRENGRTLQAASMAFQMANSEAAKASSPLRIKKLYVLAGHLYSQHSVDGSKSREASACWRAARAQHWACAAAGAAGVGGGGALRLAARLHHALPALHHAQHLQAWCIIAVISLQARAFELCSKALIKLEAIDPEVFERIAIEIFTRCKPKDAKGNKIECPHCQISIPDWSAACPGCAAELAGCAVSGRCVAPHGSWTCARCHAHAQRHELVLRHACPMCHTQLA